MIVVYWFFLSLQLQINLFLRTEDMQKDFDDRNNQKKLLDVSKRSVFVTEREIRLAHLWVNVRYEIDWKWETYERPVLVIKKLWWLFFVIPMTTKGSEWPWYYDLPENVFWKRSRLVLSQVKVIDRNRFVRKIQRIEKWLFCDIKEKLKTFLF